VASVGASGASLVHIGGKVLSFSPHRSRARKSGPKPTVLTDNCFLLTGAVCFDQRNIPAKPSERCRADPLEELRQRQWTPELDVELYCHSRITPISLTKHTLIAYPLTTRRRNPRRNLHGGLAPWRTRACVDVIGRIPSSSRAAPCVGFACGLRARQRTRVGKRSRQPIGRELVHLEGELPSDVLFELVYVPAFHAPLGVRVAAARIEWWQSERVESVELAADAAILEGALSAARGPSPNGAESRDGIAIYLRTRERDLKRDNPSPKEPLYTFALGVLGWLQELFADAESRKVLHDIALYFRD
jgi:hypothetical protein